MMKTEKHAVNNITPFKHDLKENLNKWNQFMYLL